MVVLPGDGHTGAIFPNMWAPSCNIEFVGKGKAIGSECTCLHASLFKEYLIAGNADDLRAELCMCTVGKVACRCKFLCSTTPNEEILSSSTVDLWVCINLEKTLVM